MTTKEFIEVLLLGYFGEYKPFADIVIDYGPNRLNVSQTYEIVKVNESYIEEDEEGNTYLHLKQFTTNTKIKVPTIRVNITDIQDFTPRRTHIR